MDFNIRFEKIDLLKNIEVMLDSFIPLVSNLANLTRLFMDTFTNTSWAGFYLADELQQNLYLGPFQGPIACTVIPFGKGVCGQSAMSKSTQLVPNVHLYPGHIACSSLTNSEIVVPIIKDNKCVAVIDLDSTLFENYSLNDKMLLEACAQLISKIF